MERTVCNGNILRENTIPEIDDLIPASEGLLRRLMTLYLPLKVFPGDWGRVKLILNVYLENDPQQAGVLPGPARMRFKN